MHSVFFRVMCAQILSYPAFQGCTELNVKALTLAPLATAQKVFLRRVILNSSDRLLI